VAIATVIVPIIAILAILLVIKSRSNFVRTKHFPIFLMVLVIYGILVRFVIAPFTGHPEDLGYWTNPIRLFYGSGVMDIRLYPMPLTYYPVLLSYSPYALLRILGFQDVSFLAHRIGMVESLFVKIPFVLSDIFSLYFIYKILGKLDLDESNQSKRLAYALLYFLSPVVILSSSAWPFVDGIAVVLFLAGIYYAMLKEKPIIGGLFYGLSGLTKFFGFLGFIPLSVDLIRKKKISKLSIILAMVAAIAFIVYLPLFNFNGIQSIPEFLMQFLRGRAGFGSQTSILASDSYFSYLSLMGYNVEPSYLTYLLMGLIAVLTFSYILKVRKLDVRIQKSKAIELSLLYFAIFFFIFYLIFFRIFEHYYLLVLPVLIMYVYPKRLTGPLFAAAFLSVAAAPIVLLGSLVYGAPYYWLSLKLPADTSILSVIPSTLAALAFLSILPVRGPLKVLKSGWGMSVCAGIATWFSFGLAYYAYYGVPFLGLIWYAFSVVITVAGVVFFAKVFRRLAPEG
jgi:Gpi18-like mannosyltransferase